MTPNEIVQKALRAMNSASNVKRREVATALKVALNRCIANQFEEDYGTDEWKERDNQLHIDLCNSFQQMLNADMRPAGWLTTVLNDAQLRVTVVGYLGTYYGRIDDLAEG